MPKRITPLMEKAITATMARINTLQHRRNTFVNVTTTQLTQRAFPVYLSSLYTKEIQNELYETQLLHL